MAAHFHVVFIGIHTAEVYSGNIEIFHLLILVVQCLKILVDPDAPMGNEHIPHRPGWHTGGHPQRCQIAPVLGKHGITSMPAEHIIFRQRGFTACCGQPINAANWAVFSALTITPSAMAFSMVWGSCSSALGSIWDQFDHVLPIGKGLVQLPLAKDHPHLALRLTEAGICCLRKVIDDPFTCKTAGQTG